MANYFLENPDLLFQFERLDLREVVEYTEDNFSQAEKFNYTPVNYEDAIENYKRVLEIVGDLAANFITPRAALVNMLML